MMSEPARQAPYNPVGPVSSSFKVMFRYIGPFVCMLLVCFLWRNTGLSRGGGGGVAQPNYGVILWLSEALRAFWPFGRQRRHAQLLLSLGLLLSCFSRLRDCVRSCWVRHSFHLFRHLLVLLHRLLPEGIDV